MAKSFANSLANNKTNFIFTIIEKKIINVTYSSKDEEELGGNDDDDDDDGSSSIVYLYVSPK